MTNKFNLKSEPTKLFLPQPGDKIICNNGEEFICCTLGNLKSKGVASYLDDEVSIIFGISEHWEENYSWMHWQGNNYPNDPEWNIREVVPQSVVAPTDKKGEVKEEYRYKAATEEQPLYTVEEVFKAAADAWDVKPWPSKVIQEVKDHLSKINDPQYKEYLRLKAIYE